LFALHEEPQALARFFTFSLYIYCKTSNKRPRQVLEHRLQNPWHLLEADVYSRPGVYKNTGLKPPASVTCYNTGYTVC